MPTIRDVAKLAGVAPITVSRVINRQGYISDDTRTRVEAAIAQLHYIPNSLSRSLRSKKTNMIALIVSDITNPFWTTVTRGVEDACSEHQLNVILCNTDEKPEKLNQYVTLLLQKQTDGFILVPTRDTVPVIRRIQKQEVPLVVLDRILPDVQTDIVRGDSEGGAYELTKYLLELGHRRIVMLSGQIEISTGEQRIAGYKRALADFGLPVDEALIYHGEYKSESGYTRALHVMQRVQPRPTALFAGNNFIAAGVVQTLTELGMRVPEDVSLVSFDDLPMLFKPFLTVVTQPAYDLGYQAAQLLLERIAKPGIVEPREIVLPVQMFIRDSCAPPR